MDVKLAVLADYSNVSREGKLNILGIFGAIHCRVFPATHPQMQLVMSLEAMPVEAGQPKKIEVKLVDSDGKQLFGISGQLELKAAKAGEPIRNNHILQLNNIIFEKPGDYAFHILVGDDLKETVPLKVIQIT
ncbi:MAG: hypothetical protein WC491_07635 [Candidatus Omnitrophota bacterium]